MALKQQQHVTVTRCFLKNVITFCDELLTVSFYDIFLENYR